jgi:hypothetical protein
MQLVVGSYYGHFVVFFLGGTGSQFASFPFWVVRVINRDICKVMETECQYPQFGHKGGEIA